jgi:preprotein translocase subunit SecG
MRSIGAKLASIFQDGPGEAHPLAITAFGLAFVWPVIGFILAFVARSRIAFSNGKYSGDRLAVAALVIAPIMQFSTLILGGIYFAFLAGLNY